MFSALLCYRLYLSSLYLSLVFGTQCCLLPLFSFDTTLHIEVVKLVCTLFQFSFSKFSWMWMYLDWSYTSVLRDGMLLVCFLVGVEFERPLVSLLFPRHSSKFYTFTVAYLAYTPVMLVPCWPFCCPTLCRLWHCSTWSALLGTYWFILPLWTVLKVFWQMFDLQWIFFMSFFHMSDGVFSVPSLLWLFLVFLVWHFCYLCSLPSSPKSPY